jgi:hypothetical protein
MDPAPGGTSPGTMSQGTPSVAAAAPSLPAAAGRRETSRSDLVSALHRAAAMMTINTAKVRCSKTTSYTLAAVGVCLSFLALACGGPPGDSKAERATSALSLGVRLSTSLGSILDCSLAGARCCPADASVSAEHCLGGNVGCNVATHQCEACGGPGQPCCDGPYSQFNAKNASYYNSASATCNQPATCDAQNENGTWVGPRICEVCGMAEGGPCCPPDGVSALERCAQDTGVADVNLVCVPPAGGDRATRGGTCRACGGLGQPFCDSGKRPKCDDPRNAPDAAGICNPCGRTDEPACLTDPPCDARPTDLNGKSYDGWQVANIDGICAPCGTLGNLACDHTTAGFTAPCDDGMSAPDPSAPAGIQKCVLAGGDGMPCATGSHAGYGGCTLAAFQYCGEDKICHSSCGLKGQACCVTTDQFQLSVCKDNDAKCGTDYVCVGCGYPGCGEPPAPPPPSDPPPPPPAPPPPPPPDQCLFWARAHTTTCTNLDGTPSTFSLCVDACAGTYDAAMEAARTSLGFQVCLGDAPGCCEDVEDQDFNNCGAQ